MLDDLTRSQPARHLKASQLTVHHLNTYLRGGAAAAALRLHESLLAGGVDSRFWHDDERRTRGTEDPAGTYPLRWQPRPLSLLGRCGDWIVEHAQRRKLRFETRRALRGRQQRFEIFTVPPWYRRTHCSGDLLAADILHLHWVAQLIDYRSFFDSISNGYPVVWTLHDMNAFTGGCHFSAACDRYQGGCGQCPQLARPGSEDLSRRVHRHKLGAIRNPNLHVVAPSRWLTEAARRSTILGSAASFRTIPYGIDLTAFAPRDRVLARLHYELPQDAFVLGFGADTLSNPRKGLAELGQALRRLRPDRRVIGLSFGGGELPPQLADHLQVRQVGFARGAEALSLVYSAMDLFALPSLADNLPQTGLEAMACGIPVVGFDTGGIPDFVRPGTTGHLALPGDPGSFAAELARLIHRPAECQRLGQLARRMMVQEFSAETSAHSYIELYRELLSIPRRAAA